MLTRYLRDLAGAVVASVALTLLVFAPIWNFETPVAMQELSIFGMPVYAFWSYVCNETDCPANSSNLFIPSVICPRSDKEMHCFFVYPHHRNMVPDNSQINWGSNPDEVLKLQVRRVDEAYSTRSVLTGWALFLEAIVYSALRTLFSASSGLLVAPDYAALWLSRLLGLEPPDLPFTLLTRLSLLVTAAFAHGSLLRFVGLLLTTVFLALATLLHITVCALSALDARLIRIVDRLVQDGRFMGRGPPLTARLPDTPCEEPGRACVICMANLKTHTAVPCGHTVLCNECTRTKIMGLSCPLCRGPVREWIKVFE